PQRGCCLSTFRLLSTFRCRSWIPIPASTSKRTIPVRIVWRRVVGAESIDSLGESSDVRRIAVLNAAFQLAQKPRPRQEPPRDLEQGSEPDRVMVALGQP